MTHPGVGALTALAYRLIIGTPERFSRGRQIGTYVGMVPSEDSSGGRQRLGHISKQGNSLLRFLLVEAAHPVQTNPQSSPHGYLGNALVPSHGQMNVAASPLRVDACRCLWRDGCRTPFTHRTLTKL